MTLVTRSICHADDADNATDLYDSDDSDDDDIAAHGFSHQANLATRKHTDGGRDTDGERETAIPAC